MTVRNLFRRVPARLKFLNPLRRKPATPPAVSQYALAYPEVAFTLITDNRKACVLRKGKLMEHHPGCLRYGHRRQNVGHRGKKLPPKPGRIPERRFYGPCNSNGDGGAPELAAVRGFHQLFRQPPLGHQPYPGLRRGRGLQRPAHDGKHPMAVLNISVPRKR